MMNRIALVFTTVKRAACAAVMASLAVFPMASSAQTVSSPLKSGHATALARLLPDGVQTRRIQNGFELTLKLSQAVPYRLFALSDPYRAVLEFQEVDFGAFDRSDLENTKFLGAAQAGRFYPGWSRLVLELDAPLAVSDAVMTRDDAGHARLSVKYRKLKEAAYEAQSGAPDDTYNRRVTVPAVSDAIGQDRFVLVIDPGHGGIDPGAEKDGHKEADLVLKFARELKDALKRRLPIDVVLTRDDDHFVPLETRLTIANQVGADLFLSLHADTLLEGMASGATVYTLSNKASNAASQKIAERHDRLDILAGVDLRGQDDQVAKILMDLARRDTDPTSRRFAKALINELSENIDNIHKKPHQEADFSVLRSADTPSVLLELGFMSNPTDLASLTSPNWRARAILGVMAAIEGWIEDEEIHARGRLK